MSEKGMSYADYDKALNAGQKAVMQKLQAGENVFITGNAGMRYCSFDIFFFLLSQASLRVRNNFLC